MDKSTEIQCIKCDTKMVRDELSLPRSLDLYSGSTNITDSSAATSVTIYPYGTNTTQSSPGIGFRADDRAYQRNPIKIRNYTCPSCGWKTQLRE